MSEPTDALLALKDAWNGVVDSSERVKELGASIQSLPDSSSPESLDLETVHRVVLAQSNAVMALRGLVERMRRKKEGIQE